jgi:hypothetical protein
MARTLRIAAAVVVAIAVGLAAYWFLGYRPSEFRGAGPMRDTGFFSYYRYHAPLGEFPFRAEGTYQFQFTGLPSEKMVLQFYVPGYSTKNRAEIESLKTVLATEITDKSGNVVCTANGSPATPIPARWTLMSSPFEAAYWHEACANRPFIRHTEYSLRVTVQKLDPRTPNVQLRAILEGGGNELP